MSAENEDPRVEAMAAARKRAAAAGATEVLTVYELPGGGMAVAASFRVVTGEDMIVESAQIVASVVLALQQAVSKIMPDMDLADINDLIFRSAAESMVHVRPLSGSYVKVGRSDGEA